MQVFYKTEAVKTLKNLNSAERRKVKRKIESLLSDPLAGKKLKGEFLGLRSFKAWPLRIIYFFDSKSQTITIVTVDYRG
ncbi:type II toxin-antitoxin system RelE/ParE family toxin, partial [Candidatus Gottesmanbacteria bacterium]|nr:type II toxin-antitoxin system RelE/ParE family toxin [Candidatus Gottesmanbacteria bacterium]